MGVSRRPTRLGVVLLAISLALAPIPAAAFHVEPHDTSTEGQDSIVHGSVTGGLLGTSLAVGNVNNDPEGLPDLVIGQPGAIHVIFDAPLENAEWADDPATGLPAPDVTILGSAGIGNVVATFDNGSGFHDVVTTDGGQDALLFTVPADPGTYALFDGIPVTPITVEGAIEAIAAGNLDGVGGDELAFGTPGIDSVWVHETSVEQAALLVEISGPGGSRFGASLAIGELNAPGDEHRDLVVGAPAAQGIQTDNGAGRVYAFFDPALDADGFIDSADEFSLAIAGTTAADALGASVAVADLNGDGNPDLAAGTPGWNAGDGAVFVLLGPRDPEVLFPVTDVADTAVVEGTEGTGIGTTLATGDVRIDGVDDLVIGASGGSVLVAQGGTEIGAQRFTFTDGSAGSGFGSALAVADGKWMAIGAPTAPGFEDTSQGGTVSLFAAVPAVTAEVPGLVVDSTGDQPDADITDGVCLTAVSTCTLRAAIQEANAQAGADTISFNIAGTPPHVITPTSDLPALGGGTIVDATTEPDYSGTPVVQLDWNPATDANPGSAFSITGPGVVVRGFSITNWPGNAIHISSGGSNALVELNHVGADPGGTVAGQNGGQGISVFGADGATIQDNLTSANDTGGILLQGATNTTISGNTVGTNLAGTAAIPNGIFGISAEASSANTVIDGNLVSGNPAYGIGVSGGSDNTTVTNNQVGTNKAGTTAIPNGTGVLLNGAGSPTEIGPGNLLSGNISFGIQVIATTAIDVFIDGNQIGTDASGEALGNGEAGVWADGSDLWIGSVTENEIAFNTGAGIDLRNVASSTIRMNSIHDNGGLGIDYVEAPVAAPVIDSVTTGADIDTGPFVEVSGTISQPLSDFTIVLFANSVCDPSGSGEGERFLGSDDVNIIEGTTTEFSVRVDGALNPGEVVTALLGVPQSFTSEFSACVGEEVPAVVDTLNVTVDQASTGPGATSVNLIDIPVDAVFAASEVSSTSASPLGSVPLGSVDLNASPLGAVPLGAVPLGSVPLGSVPLGAVPLGAVTVDFAGGWSALLAGTPFDGRPLQTVLLSDVIAYANANPGSDLASVALSQLSLEGTPLGSVSLASLALGALPLGSVSPDGCTEANNQGFTCDPNSTTLIELELAGFDVASAPLGSVPLGAVPLGSVPLGSVPLGSVPLGSVPLGSVPLGSVPLGSVPLGAVPLGAVDLAGTPLGAVPLSLIDGCTVLNCSNLGLNNDSTLHEAAVAWEANNSTTLTSSPLGSVPLGSIPLGSVPLGSIPLGSVPLGAVDLAGTPLGSVPLGAVGGCSLLSGFAHTCTTLGADDGTSLYELAVLLEAAGSSLAASPLGSVPIDQLPLGSIDPLLVLGLNATLADIFCEAFDGNGDCAEFLADVENWGSITLGQIIIALLIAADYPWEELEFDELGVQDFAATGSQITYTATLGVSSGPGPVEVTATLPANYRYKPGTSTLGESSVLDPVIDESGSVQTLRFFLTLGEGTHSLSFGVAPGLRLGTSTVDMSASDGTNTVSAPDTAAHTVVEGTPVGVIDPDVLYFGYITSPADVDTYGIVPPGEGFRTSVFLGHLSEDLDLVMYRPTTAPTTVSGTPLGSVPFRDEGFEAATSEPLSPEALADIPVTDPGNLAAVSASRATTPESTSVVEDGTGSGNYTVEVSGYNGVTSDDPYMIREKVRSEVPVPDCTTRGAVGGGTSDLSALSTPGLESLFVVNGARLDAFHGAGSSTAVLGSLNSLVAYLNDPANGFGTAAVVRVDGVGYGAWDTNPCDWKAANAIAEEIRDPIVDYAEANPSLKYVTIVGSDEVIPFFRQPDDTSYANESTYAGEFEDNALFGTFTTRHILTDDGYGDLDPIPWLDHALFLPELGVGRMVEEPPDIIGQVDTFLAFDGTLDRSTGFVSGYDFLTDGANDVATNLTAGGASTTSLISETWTDDDLIGDLLVPDAVPDLASPNTHYDHHRSLPAAEQGTPEGGLTDDVLFDVSDVEAFGAANPGDLSRTVLFTMGCHAGTSVADVSILAGSTTNPTDWAQVYGREAANYAANSGYGYGDTVTVALSERLMADYASRMDGSLSAGQAMVATKQHYFGNLGLYGVYDEKAMQEVIFYGLPMYRVGAPGGAPTTPAEPEVITEPGTGLGVATFELTPLFDQVDTEIGTFFAVDDDTQGIHYRPIQPKVSNDVTVAGRVAKGALITDLETSDVPVPDPAFFRPIIDDSKNEAEIENFQQIFPTTFAGIATFQTPSTEPGTRTETRQNLNVIPGQYVGATRTQRLFDRVEVEVLYVDEGSTGVTDFTPPTFQTVNAAIVDGTATFVVDLADNADAVRVLAMYRDASGAWRSAELASGSPWTGGGSVAPGTTQIEFFVQAVDAAGNVGLTDFKGGFHDAFVVPTNLPTDNPAVTVDGATGERGWFTSPPTVTVTGDSTYTAFVDGVPQDLSTGSFTIGEDGAHIVEIFGGQPDPVVFAVKVDQTPPQITIRSPGNGNTYLLDQVVPADFRCADAGSGILSCAGSVPDGAPFDTSSTGSFAVTATDFAGHPGSASVDYQVVRPLDLSVSPDLVAINETVTATSPLDGVFDSVVIDWGDGTTCSVGVDNPCSVTDGTFTATKSYPDAGVFTVTITAEYQGLTLTDNFQYVVVFDPSAGFVTGGGNYDSPPGAFVADPTKVGVAHFGFVSRYKKGQSVPSGNTAFEFAAADLRFKSTSYEWLVISGATARYKGEGELNGQGGFGFILSAFDANLNSNDNFNDDLFRIKIWDLETEETVYDTSCNADGVCEEDLPGDVKKGAVAIRGSIVIHE